ncbi:hypothetical protein [Candidatus Kryptonium thompsonii]|uniref:hypothetical protein n=1 Tax=Candidatus Kryptonium thompsonii TaxID=1633631 RepID=UPI00094D7EB0|nr:hypothetical protein [Candidatus Kryptonium thompsoni]
MKINKKTKFKGVIKELFQLGVSLVTVFKLDILHFIIARVKLVYPHLNLKVSGLTLVLPGLKTKYGTFYA